jgi:formylglycine-generating enzyme required for sulfatase activity
MSLKKVAFWILILFSLSFSLSVTTGLIPKRLTASTPIKEEHRLEGECRHCHADTSNLLTDTSQPECQECHGTNPKIPPYVLPISQVPEEKIIMQDLVLIPGGSFIMGSPGRPATEGEGNEDEGPAHKVEVETFYMDLYETTNAHYQEFIKATGASTPLLWRRGSYPAGKPNHPVVYVSWHEADAFCRWKGKRLPNEAEWEKAARGTDQRHFPWGIQFDANKANTPQHSLSKGIAVSKGGTTPVGSFEEGKSPYGLYDMAGNVYEWTSSWYLPYPGNGVNNIHYGRRNKVLRGGSWYNCMSYGCGLSSPVYNRSRFTPEIKNKGFGFRCAADKKTQT